MCWYCRSTTTPQLATGLCDDCAAILGFRREVAEVIHHTVEALWAAFQPYIAAMCDVVNALHRLFSAIDMDELRRHLDGIEPVPPRPAPGRQPSFRGRDRRHTRGGKGPGR